MRHTEKTLVLVDDDPVLASALKRQLQKLRYEVHHVVDRRQAVQVVAQADDPIDLILMDVDLGAGISGADVAREILRHRQIPIMFLSSHSEAAVVDTTAEVDSYGYVLKSSGIAVIDASIQMAL